MTTNQAALLLLAALALGGCRTPREEARDYDGARRRAGQAHSAHDSQDPGVK